MRKMFLFMMITADGYFEGVDHDLSWHNTDTEFNDFAVNQLDEVDTLVFGRKTYDLMANYWPTAAGKADDTATAQRMNSLQKIVFSESPIAASWENVKSYEDNVAKVINSLKQKPGKAIAVLGSSNLCLTLLKEGLIDEVRLMINPIALGRGTALFAGLGRPGELKLTSTRTFNSGNVLLVYDVKKS